MAVPGTPGWKAGKVADWTRYVGRALGGKAPKATPVTPPRMRTPGSGTVAPVPTVSVHRDKGGNLRRDKSRNGGTVAPVPTVSVHRDKNGNLRRDKGTGGSVSPVPVDPFWTDASGVRRHGSPPAVGGSSSSTRSTPYRAPSSASSSPSAPRQTSSASSSAGSGYSVPDDDLGRFVRKHYSKSIHKGVYEKLKKNGYKPKAAKAKKPGKDPYKAPPDRIAPGVRLGPD